MHIHVYTDGGARGNPGVAGCGFAVYNAHGDLLQEGYKPLGHMTNNQAEYLGALHGLTCARSFDPDAITLYMDSELVVKQLQGLYKVKHPQMKELFAQIQEVVADFSGEMEICHVPREQNTHADMLSNKAMDEQAHRSIS